MGVSALELRRRVLMAQPHKERKTGGIVSFNTHVPQVLPVSVDLLPVQAGAGDPYPPGGGKNKYPIAIGEDDFTNNGGATHSNDNGSLIINTDATSGASGIYANSRSSFGSIFESLEVPFTVSVEISATASGNVRLVVCGSQRVFEVGTEKQRISVTATSKSTKNFNIYGVNNGATLTASNLQIEEGSTATDFAPYSNIRPITGRTGATVGRKGKNLIQTPAFGTAGVIVSDFGTDIFVDAVTFSIKANDTIAAYVNAAVVDLREENGTHHYITLSNCKNSNGQTFKANELTNGKYSKTLTGIKFRYVYAYYTDVNYSRFNGDNVTEWQLEPGETASEYAPYSGESFPFTFPATGKNLYNPAEAETGKWLNTETGETSNSSAYWVTGFIPVTPGETYVKPDMGSSRSCGYDEEKRFVTGIPWMGNSKQIPEGVYFIRCTGKTETIAYDGQVQIEKGSTATAYEPYTNTVYGGRLEPAAGRLVVEWVSITADGVNVRCTGQYGNSGPVTLPSIPITRNPGTTAMNVKASCFRTASNSADVQNKGNSLIIGNAGQLIAIHIDGIQGTDGSQGYESMAALRAAANAWLAENPAQICYKLANPIIIPLTPAEIRALMGENNVFSDAGDVDVEFWTN